MYHETCYFSSNYDDEIRSLADPVAMANMTKVVQFPYSEPDVVEKTEEELAAQKERRREHGRRLQEMQAKQRAEKVGPNLIRASLTPACRQDCRARRVQDCARGAGEHEEGRLHQAHL
jgi:hypothetical protein